MRKPRVSSLLCLTLSCLTFLSALPAHGAPPDETTVAMARERFKEGVAFFDKKEYDKARVAFLQAYALKKHPAVLLNLAQSELRSSHEAEAAKHFAAYLRESKDASESERAAAEAGLNATKAMVAEVTVNVDEGGAEVFVDSSSEGVSPLAGSVYVTPGSHSIEARKGGKSAATQINANAGRQLTANLTFAPKPVKAAAAAPVVATEPSDTSEPAPEPEAPVEPGAGRKPFFKWLVSSPVGVVGLGLTGVGLGVGVGGALASNHSYNNADSIADQIKKNAAADSNQASPDTSSLCSDPESWLTQRGYLTNMKTPDLGTRVGEYKNACSKYPDNVNKGDTLKTVATVGFVVGGVAAVGTIVYYFIDPNARESSAKEAQASRRRIAIVPTVGPTQSGLTVVGSF
ncbi:MAG: hypothetical protein ABUL62_31275 [Myxococcales bacterium]